MNPDTGDFYESMRAARDAGEIAAELIEIRGTHEQVEKLSADIKRLRAIDEDKFSNEIKLGRFPR